MLDSTLDLLIGASGTALYLYLWNLAISRHRSDEDLPEAASAKRRVRRHSWQLLFFIAMTPYVLFLFFLMERVRSLFDMTPPAQ